MILGPAAALCGVGYYYFTSGRFISIDNAYVRADKVDISSDIGGTVASVDVTENEPVAAGQVLLRLDDNRLQIAVARAEGQLAATRTEIEVLKANYRQKLEMLKQAQLDVAYYQHEYERQADLARNGAAPLSKLDDARHRLDTAREAILELDQDLAAINASLGGNPDIAVEKHPRMLIAQADLDEAERQLRHAVIRAPFAGIATQVHKVQPGEYLVPAQPAVSLVATDHVWIEANPKETELTHVAAGQPATVTVDSYPGVRWDAQVDSLSPASGAEFALLPAQNTSGNWVKVVQRIPVELRVVTAADRPMLRSGMSVQVSIDTGYQRPMPAFLSELLGVHRAAASVR